MSSRVRLTINPDGSQVFEGDDEAIARLSKRLREEAANKDTNQEESGDSTDEDVSDAGEKLRTERGEGENENRESDEITRAHLNAQLLSSMEDRQFQRDAKARLEAYWDNNRKFRFTDALKIWADREIPSTLPNGGQNPEYPKALKFVKGLMEDYMEKNGLLSERFRIGRSSAYHLYAKGETPDTLVHNPALGRPPPSAEVIARYIDSLGGDRKHTLPGVIRHFTGQKMRSKLAGTTRHNPIYLQWKDRLRQARTLLAEEQNYVFETVGSGQGVAFRLAPTGDYPDHDEETRHQAENATGAKVPGWSQ